jgi:hypothetical protein
MRDQGVTAVDLARLAGALSELPSWERVPRRLEAADHAERISLEPVALAERDTANVVIDALDALLASPGGRSVVELRAISVQLRAVIRGQSRALKGCWLPRSTGWWGGSI